MIDNEQFSAEVNQIIKERVQFIERHYPRVREAYQSAYEWPEMDTLRYEVALTITFGLCQSAITLTNHWLESLLKTALILHDSKHHPDKGGPIVAFFVRTFAPGRAKHGGQNLGRNIDTAMSLDLITHEEHRMLHEFRVTFRNAYSHSDKGKTFGAQRITGQGIRIENGRFVMDDPETARIAELGFVQGIAQAEQAQLDAVPYFLYLDALTRRMRDRLFVVDAKHAG